MLPPEDLESIESLLRQTLIAARERRFKAKMELELAVSEIPSGLPAPDGGTRIHNAATAERYASRAYYVAMRRLYDFLLDGKVPEDLDAQRADPERTP